MYEIIMAKQHETDIDKEFELLSQYMTYYINYLHRKYKSKTGKIKYDTFEIWKLKQKPKSKSKNKKKTIKISTN